MTTDEDRIRQLLHEAAEKLVDDGGAVHAMQRWVEHYEAKADNWRYERNREIVRLFLAGHSYVTIGGWVGLGWTTVQDICRKAGVRRRDRGSRGAGGPSTATADPTPPQG